MNDQPEPASNPDLPTHTVATIAAASHLLELLVHGVGEPTAKVLQAMMQETGGLVGVTILFGMPGAVPRTLMVASDSQGENIGIVAEVHSDRVKRRLQ